MMDAPSIAIVYRDDSLVVVDKPAGLLAVPGRGEHKRDCATARVQQQFADALVVHRLDQATSGLLLLARGESMQRRLGIAFESRSVGKRYVAVVAGHVAEDAGTIDLPLAADWPNRPRQQVERTQGKPSTTRWRVLQRNAGTTRLELEPLTGRSHQLRVHLLAIGHPIAGDTLYAPPEVAAFAPRLLLHASELAFMHPASGAPVSLRSDAPF